MERLTKVAIFLLVAVCFWPALAQASKFNSQFSKVYSGDFNQDGREDIFIKASPGYVIIAGDIDIPVLVNPEVGDVLLIQQPNGEYTVDYNLSQADLAVLNTWTTQNYELVAGDFNGDGLADAFLQAKTAGDNSVMLLAAEGTAAPTYDKTLTAADFGFDIANATVKTSDLNFDGRDDLTISRSGQPDYHWIATDVPDASQLVGATAGSFRVDESGSATYSIPLVEAPGSGGVQPQISLNYSSQGGNGIMGVGWSIGGLSTITRCRQTKETDGQSTAVDLTSDDRFCLDGQKLVAVSGTYGASGTEYRNRD